MPGLSFDCAPYVGESIPSEGNGTEVMMMSVYYSGGSPYIFFQTILRNRVIGNNPDKFLYISFAELEFENDSDNALYKQHVKDVLTNGVEVAGKLYLFCGHTNSQLRERSCFLYHAKNHSDVSAMISRFGNFQEISDVSKRSKRIGQLFSSSEKVVGLNYQEFGETEDVARQNGLFMDECGFITQDFAKEIMQKCSTKRGGSSYVPQVFQVRYRGYKGNMVVENEEVMKRAVIPRTRQQILMSWVYLLLSITFWKILLFLKEIPSWDLKVVFRKSMKTFSNCPSNDFYILEHSKPSSPVKMNPEMISILSSLGVPDEIFVKKLQEYLDFIRNLRKTKEDAIKFLEYKGRFDLIKRLMPCDKMNILPKRLNEEFKRLEKEEIKSSFDRNQLDRFQILIQQSRRLLGVRDTTGKLKKGQCMVKVTMSRRPLRSYILNGRILVAKNGSLNPGHIQVLDAVYLAEFDHLVDCIVFSREGEFPIISSEMNCYDLDHDSYFVSWDKDLIPPITVPPLDNSIIQSNCNNEFQDTNQQLDLIQYFTNYNQKAMKKLLSLYSQWIRGSDGQGSFSIPCLTISILYQKCLNGEGVDIPQWLMEGPLQLEYPTPFILDKLEAMSRKYSHGRFAPFFDCLPGRSRDHRLFM